MNRDQLVCHRDPLPAARPRLTVTLASKWYGLYLLHLNGDIEGIRFGELDELWNTAPGLEGSAYCDHVPNPTFVVALAAKRGWDIHDLALELIVGRWRIEYEHVYDKDLTTASIWMEAYANSKG